MSKEANEMITAIGALAEVGGELYRQLVKNGFEHKDAMELVKEYIAITLTPNRNTPRE